jgi:hypothetical protein
MATGSGTHVKMMVQGWLGVKTSGCGGCQSLLEEMDRNGPDWCRKNFGRICNTVRSNAHKNKDWRAKILSHIPGVQWPIRAMVLLAISRCEAEIAAEAEKSKPIDNDLTA